MEATNLHYTATQARNKKVETVFAAELDKIEQAAEAGHFNIILDNNNFTNSFIHYLINHNFYVKYFRHDKQEWFDCYESTKIIWDLCSKIYVAW